ncbi:YdcF family protein [Candidatus Pelagibacter sp.]|nr:YdcF family protein [Candidatus Pelagibacter sp.]MDC3349140.1 YdcF family protein [Candidatus Pelagibacter sp.]
MIYLHKFLPLIVSPLFLVLIIILIGTYLKSNKISLFGLLVLIFCSLPIISNKLIFYLEKDYSLQDVSNIGTADAIVVLSGMVATIETKENLNYEFSTAVDRILSGIDLFKENKAPFLILTNGKLPWSVGIPEGEYLKKFSIKFGIPKESILLTDNVQNTDQEAKSVKKLLNTNEANIILVTSAFHMPRAKKVFEAANIKVIPFAVDFRNSANKVNFMDFIPSANSFRDTSHFVREIIGRLYYNLKY